MDCAGARVISMCELEGSPRIHAHAMTGGPCDKTLVQAWLGSLIDNRLSPREEFDYTMYTRVTNKGGGQENTGTYPLCICSSNFTFSVTREHMATGVYFLPLRLLGPSLPEASPPLVSASLVMAPPFFVFFKWCSGIHSSSYPLELAVARGTGASIPAAAETLGFLDLGKNERKAK